MAAPDKSVPKGSAAPTRADIERCVVHAYIDRGGVPATNAEMYASVCEQLCLDLTAFKAVSEEDRQGREYSTAMRSARWAQQTLKAHGLLESVGRGVWALTEDGREKLLRPNRGTTMLAFSTKLGIGVWGDARDVFGELKDDITLMLSSPPYPIHKGRAYGTVTEAEYTDWICSILEPVIARLKPGGSLVLIVGNDVFVKGSPARSLYRERLVLALADRYGLDKMDTLIWHNGSKAPGPVRWASMTRQQLNCGYEAALWFAKDARQCLSNNMRVLQPHTDRHRRELEKGFQRSERHSDGAYSLRPGRSFANQTRGKIPRNVLSYGHSCSSQRRYKRQARELGLPVHGAPLPCSLVKFLVEFLSAPGDLVVEPFGGSMTVPLVCEQTGRPWIASELYGQYIAGGAGRFAGADGLSVSDQVLTAVGVDRNHFDRTMGLR